MALLVATSFIKSVVANKRVAYVLMPAASNNDTWDAAVAGITAVDFATADFNDASTAAADSTAVTWSGSTLTFTVAGTARAQAVTVYGRGTG
jgi:hypothetical protein